MRHLRRAAVMMLLGAGPALAEPPRCPAGLDGPPVPYRNARFGFGFDRPPAFVLDPASVPETGDSARFWAAGRRATVVVNASRPRRPPRLSDLLAEAEGDVVQNSGGEITYRRTRDDWFVISGHMVGRIFYRRTFVAPDGVVATLWMEFPREMRPCLDAAVTTMSLSFRAR